MSNSTTHCVYRIVCFPTAKIYVGQTNRPKVRRKEHFGSLKAGTHCNQRLQFAYNKYGHHSFYFEILERNIPASSINDREIYWIAHFDSYENGYNLSPGGYIIGEGVGTPCVWDGVKYRSFAAAAKATGISTHSLSYRAAKGYKSDSDMVGTGSVGRKSVLWNGVYYRSITEAAVVAGVSAHCMGKWIKRGYSCVSDLRGGGGKGSHKSKVIIWNGVRYPSISAAARANNVAVRSMSERVSRGYTCDSDMIKPRRR